MKAHKILHWYTVLRVNYRFTAFQAIRFALWLARGPDAGQVANVPVPLYRR